MLNAADYAATFFRAVDNRDWVTWRSLVADDITVRFANQAPTDGSSFEAMVDGAAESIPRVTHRIGDTSTQESEEGDVVIAEMTVSYDLANGTNHELPAVGIIRRRNGLGVDYRVFVDLSPVLASLAA